MCPVHQDRGLKPYPSGPERPRVLASGLCGYTKKEAPLEEAKPYQLSNRCSALVSLHNACDNAENNA